MSAQAAVPGRERRALLARAYLVLAGLAGAAAVVCGALGAHLLDGSLAPSVLKAYETGVAYLLVHAAVLAAIAFALRGPAAPRGLGPAGAAFATGMLLFSGTLITRGLDAGGLVDIASVGRAAPLGGLALIAGWLMLAAAALVGGRRTMNEKGMP